MDSRRETGHSVRYPRTQDLLFRRESRVGTVSFRSTSGLPPVIRGVLQGTSHGVGVDEFD